MTNLTGESNFIEADDRVDVDSAYQDESESYTTSLRSSITNYTFENGRRYHAYKDGSYFLPNDESENQRLDLVHHLMTQACGGRLHYAPIEQPQRILDLGTGTGIWALEMADEYPGVKILGNDLSPIQPSWVPPGVVFEVDDIETDWVYSEPFDYIHCRFLAGAISDWPKLVSQAFKFTKPGGWVEFQDFTMTMYTKGGEYTPDSPCGRCSTELLEAFKAAGKVAEPGPLLEGWVKDAGFTNISHRLLPIPTGTWPKERTMKEIGAIDLMQFQEGLDAMTMRILTTFRGWKPDDLRNFLKDVRTQLKNPRMRMQHDFHVVWAQKPRNVE